MNTRTTRTTRLLVVSIAVLFGGYSAKAAG